MIEVTKTQYPLRLPRVWVYKKYPGTDRTQPPEDGTVYRREVCVSWLRWTVTLFRIRDGVYRAPQEA